MLGLARAEKIEIRAVDDEDGAGAGHVSGWGIPRMAASLPNFDTVVQ
jgi:hypothetical protein